MNKEKVPMEQAKERAGEQEAVGNKAPGEAAPMEALERQETAEETLRRLEEEKAEVYDQLLRQRAEFENARKRLEREFEERRQFAEAQLVESVLPVLDGFERALDSMTGSASEEFRKGVELIHKQLLDTLKQAGLRPLEAEGKTFDPFYHHAVERVETLDYPDHQVIEQVQRGYQFKDRLLRPALVKVATHPAEESPEEAVD